MALEISNPSTIHIKYHHDTYIYSIIYISHLTQEPCSVITSLWLLRQ